MRCNCSLWKRTPCRLVNELLMSQLACCLGGWRKPESPEEANTDTRGTRETLQTEPELKTINLHVFMQIRLCLIEYACICIHYKRRNGSDQISRTGIRLMLKKQTNSGLDIGGGKNDPDLII